MVAILQKGLAIALTTGLTLLMGVESALAVDDTAVAVPVTITLTDVMETNVPLYISVQTEAEYQSMKGRGAVLKETSAGTITQTVQLPESGDYAVTIWHDLDNDGRFSMTDRYEVLDGWGTSGQARRDAAPTFQQSKINVPTYGASVTIAMIYPKH
ncbi:hypothetical protein GCM10009069_03160 [Algimonas arctica]|uniref:DUF2141 domain-containing protein n=1 Tax=Algimonas arctica TaxID=1479486 RepID=A0A8J3CNS4_9PROT|nr:DUF2141 domain-containing protein [Algimonas arctica]GHA83239.1 hypothetical protein GCM10009069_03160 [Algimonas arctica]